MSAAPLTAAEIARLAALADIVEPAAIPFWPPAAGWLLVGLLALLLAMRVAQQRWQRWQHNRYRRLAQRRLRPLEAAADTLPAQQLLSEALAVLRDCALAMPAAQQRPAERTAWIAFLQTCLPARQTFLPEALLHEAAYWPPERVSRDDARAVLSFVRDWVDHHGAPA